MKEFNKDIIFESFNVDAIERKEKELFGQKRNEPGFLMRFICKGLVNYTILDVVYRHKYGEKYMRVRDRLKYKLYNSFYCYLLRIPVDKINRNLNTSIITNPKKEDDTVPVYNALETLLKFFEGLEQYERCTFIKHYIDKLENNSIKELVN